ncbi:MAG: dihydrolipoamide acetyltransferase family protein [Spirochaetia bacterium]|jgi:pyruvate dehydrogenase E2 component (dihydrolipoamide acetyltransferase)|nr:dihydrolipoamide acetyltransferase family protein [Spirochaetia bacterium]
MRYIFKFPDIGEGITEGRILEWYVKKGQVVKSGESLVKMETDKVVADIPSPKNGVIAVLFGNVGETINVKDPLVEIEISEISGESAQELSKEKPGKPEPFIVEEEGFGVVGTLEIASDNAILSSSKEGIEKIVKANENLKKVLATPVARAMAKDLQVEITNVEGTGPGGRITKIDIRKTYDNRYEKHQFPAAEDNQDDLVEYETLSQIRKTIAKNMIHSKQNAAHMSAFEEVEVSRLITLRKQYKEQFAEQDLKLSYLPFILKAIALSLKNNKSLNSEMDMDNNRMVYKNFINLGIAVDTENGLVVPVIKNADKLSIKELTRQIQFMSDKARDRQLTLEDLKDGTFTVTNYGSIGGLFAVPIINYPQAGILGIGRIHQKPIVKNGEIVIGNILPLSLSVDHRIVDGGETTRFLNEVKGYLNDPVSMLF